MMTTSRSPRKQRHSGEGRNPEGGSDGCIGIHFRTYASKGESHWIPAFAGMTHNGKNTEPLKEN